MCFARFALFRLAGHASGTDSKLPQHALASLMHRELQLNSSPVPDCLLGYLELVKAFCTPLKAGVMAASSETGKGRQDEPRIATR